MKKSGEVKTNAMRILDQHLISYQTYTYECEEFIDGVTTAHLLNIPLEKAYKTLVTISNHGSYYVFLIPVGEELDLKKAARFVQEKSLELLPVKSISIVTGYVRGGCTPIGMKRQFPTIIDRDAEKLTTIVISGGRIGSQIELATSDLIKVIYGKYADIKKESHSSE